MDAERAIEEIPGEVWKTIKESKDYQVSNRGRIRSGVSGQYVLMNYRMHGQVNRIRCGEIAKGGFEILLHRAVAEAFHENPFGDKRVVFVDGNNKNCSADNVQWLSVYWHKKAIENLSNDPSPNAQAVLKFMLGDKTAMDHIWSAQLQRLPGLVGYLMTFYRDIYGIKGYVDVNNVAQDAVVKAMTTIRRGLLRDVTKINAWFSCIARNTLINAGRKTFYCGIDDLKGIRQSVG
jgi:hypothetical protein